MSPDHSLRKTFKTYLLEQAKPYQDTIDLVKRLKAVYGLRVAVVSNEGREIAEDRIGGSTLRSSSISSLFPPSFTSANQTSTFIASRWTLRTLRPTGRLHRRSPTLVRRRLALGPSSRAEPKRQGNARKTLPNSTSFFDGKFSGFSAGRLMAA